MDAEMEVVPAASIPQVNEISQIEVSLAIKLTADEPISKSYLTYIGWAIPAKHSKPGEYQLYEGGVLRYNPSST